MKNRILQAALPVKTAFFRKALKVFAAAPLPPALIRTFQVWEIKTCALEPPFFALCITDVRIRPFPYDFTVCFMIRYFLSCFLSGCIINARHCDTMDSFVQWIYIIRRFTVTFLPGDLLDVKRRQRLSVRRRSEINTIFFRDRIIRAC